MYTIGNQINGGRTYLFEKRGTNIKRENSNNAIVDHRINTAISHNIQNLNNSKKSHIGWVKVESKGMGKQIISPFHIFKLDAPILTPQYDAFLPFRIGLFWIYCLYNDENAVTTITYRNGTNKTIKGNHSLSVCILKIPPAQMLRFLLQDGVIDGVRFLKVQPIAGILRLIRNSIFGGELIDISDDTNQFLKTLFGRPPQFNPQTPIFRGLIPSLSRKILETIFGEIPIATMRGFFYFPKAIIMNQMGIRCPIIGYQRSLNLFGFTPFVWWNEQPNILLQKCVKIRQQCINRPLKVIKFYDEKIQLLFPFRHEKLSQLIPITSATLPIIWIARDFEYTGKNLPISLFYSTDNGGTWRLIEEKIPNDGIYNWDTTNLSDGTYRIRIIAHDEDNSVGYYDSGPFNISKGQRGPKISHVYIIDQDINSRSWVKNGDTVTVVAELTNAVELHESDIIANLSGFGHGSNQEAQEFSNYTATWTLDNVRCHPCNRNSDVTVSVKIKTMNESKQASITADNSDPIVAIKRMEPGVYLFNHKLILISKVIEIINKTIIVGPLTIQIDADDNFEISRINYYFDNVSIPSETINVKSIKGFYTTKWYMNYRLIGEHILTVKVYDRAENTKSITKEFVVFNFIGK